MPGTKGTPAAMGTKGAPGTMGTKGIPGTIGTTGTFRELVKTTKVISSQKVQ